MEELLTTNGHGGLSTTSGIQDYNVSKNRTLFGGEDIDAYLNTVDVDISSAVLFQIGET